MVSRLFTSQADFLAMGSKHTAMLETRATEMAKDVIQCSGNAEIVAMSPNGSTQDSWSEIVVPGNSHIVSIELLTRIRDHRRARVASNGEVPFMSIVLDSCGEHGIMKSDVLKDIVENGESMRISLFMTFQHGGQIPQTFRKHIHSFGIPYASDRTQAALKNIEWVANKVIGDGQKSKADQWYRTAKMCMQSVAHVCWMTGAPVVPKVSVSVIC